MTHKTSIPTPRAALLALLLVALSATLTGCGDSSDTPPYIPGDGDAQDQDGEEAPWNPGDYDPDQGCSGYGGDGEDGACPDPSDSLDCSLGPCVFGTCVISASGNHCECEEGYDGKLCDACADGYVVQGLRCVVKGPCEEMPCAYGTCHVINEQPFCTCDEGYAGTLCDACAPGYHEDDLRCVAD